MKILIVLALQVLSLQYAFCDPKYGPHAVPLTANSNRDYFIHNEAPDYWALSSFYLPQPNDRACSATSFTMVLNALRSKQDLTTKDELVTVQSLLDKYSDDRYKNAMNGTLSGAISSMSHSEVANTRLVQVLKTAMDKLKLTTPSSAVENHLIDENNLIKSRREFHDMLVKNEKSSDDFIILSFVQGVLTGDSEGMIAHIAPIGAYDEKKHLVLVMDPDRQWYGPYWSPEDKVFDAVADKRSDSEHPSWIYVRLK
jgi:hypothetical protein